ncbi:MAG: hypothetical protein JWO78_2323 [Micavibrio sp.]|nr:hypothetical protein [Micavibrio sp.]
MQSYKLSPAIRKKMAEDEPAVKSAIAKIANAEFGIFGDTDGIGKYEGGVLVNTREIAIKTNCVMDDWRRCIDPTPEEVAVVKAIDKVAAIIRGEKNILRRIMNAVREEPQGIRKVRALYGECTSHDPLRSLLEGP